MVKDIQLRATKKARAALLSAFGLVVLTSASVGVAAESISADPILQQIDGELKHAPSNRNATDGFDRIWQGGEAMKFSYELLQAARDMREGALKADPEMMRKVALGFEDMGDQGNYLLWAQKAIDAGSSRALGELADGYRFGILVGKDAAKGLDLLKKAAEKGDVDSEVSYALELENLPGDHGEQTYRLFQSAAAHGSTFAMIYWGQYLILGHAPHEDEVVVPGVVKDPAKGAELIKRAADMDDKMAQSEYGRLLMRGADGVPPDEFSGIEYLRRAAQHGDEHAQFSLAQCYAKGTAGLPRDYVEAYVFSNLVLQHSGGLVEDDARKMLDSLEAKMSPDQVARAQQATKEFKREPDAEEKELLKDHQFETIAEEIAAVGPTVARQKEIK